MNNINFHEIELSGTPYECGYQHGQAIKSVLTNIINKWAERIKENTKLTLEEYAKKIKQETKLSQTIQTYASELLEEVHGIADGANLPKIIIETWQYLDEHEWFISNFINKKDTVGNACSSLGYRSDSSVIIGQNLDIPTYKNGIQTLLKYKNANGTYQYIFTQAGAIASLGCNNSPLALCVNSLTQLSYRVDGLPVTYIIRKVLQSSSLDEAVTVLKKLPHATGHNYIIGDRKNFYDFECSASEIHLYESNLKNIVYHTNHPLANFDGRNKMKVKPPIKGQGTSVPRFECLQSHLRPNISIDINTLKTALATPPVSITAENNSSQFTFISALFDLGQNIKIYAAPGAPQVYSYKEYQFN